MTGFGQDSKNENKSSGIYARLLGLYVRVFFGGNNVLVGRLYFTDHVQTHLDPYIVNLGTDLSTETRIVKDDPAIIRTDSITAVIPLGLERNYLEKIVREAAEKDVINTFLREKDLRKKGFYEEKK